MEAFFELHSSATGRKKSLHWSEKMFLGASKEFLNNFYMFREVVGVNIEDSNELFFLTAQSLTNCVKSFFLFNGFE